MKLKLLYAFAFVFTFSICNTSAQSQKKQHLKLVKYKDNVNAPLTNKERSMLEEVFLDKLDEYVLNRPQRLKNIKHFLRNRVEIKKMPKLIKNTQKYTLLSQVGLFNLYNKKLEFDKTFNKEKFNPLKYNLERHGHGGRIYRIDNTSYFILIKSQHQ